MAKSIEFFKQQQRSKSGFYSVIILFSIEHDVGELLDVHARNKKLCIANGLMLGILYETNMASSLHDKQYYPLRTCAPILVLRNMVVSDLLFLDPDHYGIASKIVFLQSFIRSFQGAKSPAAKQQITEAKKYLRAYEQQLRLYKICKWLLLTAVLLLTYWFFTS